MNCKECLRMPCPWRDGYINKDLMEGRCILELKPQSSSELDPKGEVEEVKTK